MNVKELIEKLEKVDPTSEVILVAYTADGYESGYVDRVDPHCKFNSVNGKKLDEDESVVELTTKVGVDK